VTAMYLLPGRDEVEAPDQARGAGEVTGRIGAGPLAPVSWPCYAVGVVSALIILLMGVFPGLLLYLLTIYHA